MKASQQASYNVAEANATIPIVAWQERSRNLDVVDFRRYAYHEPCKWNVYKILVSLIVAQSTVTIILKFIVGVLIINHQISSWKIFNLFLTGETELPNDEAQLKITIAVGVFTAVGVLTGFLMLWDMIIETLKEFGRAGKMKGKHVKPYFELWIILMFEEIPKATIRLCVLILYSVKDPSKSWLILIYEWETIIIPDVITVFIRFFSAVTRLYTACQPAIDHFKAIGKQQPSYDVADFGTRQMIQQIRRKKKELPAPRGTCWQKTAILMAVIMDIILMIALLGLTIAYVVLKSMLNKK